MLIEHTFVTTYAGPDATRIAAESLVGLGFSVEQQTDCRLQVRRGIRNPAYAKSLNQLPQSILMEYDRGRVTLAVSIQTHRKPTFLHEHFAVAVAQVLELLLAYRQSLVEAHRPWEEVQARIGIADARARTWKLWMIVILVGLILSLAGVCVVALNSE